MRKVSTIKELVDFAYAKYKTKNAITMNKEYIKNINYFNYRFDIYSLARVLKYKEKRIKNRRIAIISENRYEVLVTFLANAILNNTIIIIDGNLTQETISKAIKKYDINTVFFSNKNKEKIIEIYKLNNTNKKKIINLINFDSNNKFPIIEYEKLINIGRYIENYSIDNINEVNEKNKNTIIINTDGTKEYNQQDFIESTYIIGRGINLKKRKNIKSQIKINTFYKIVIDILLPLLYGLNIKYCEEEVKDKWNISIVEESKKGITVYYRDNKYIIENKNLDTYVLKVEDNLLKKSKRKETPNFILIKSTQNQNLNYSRKLTNTAK